jgi:dihydroorotate dehydrogenase (fumarate)
MADLTTRYMGLTLSSPLVLASSSLSNRVENFQTAEACGAGAVVLRSLFEEQLQASGDRLRDDLARAFEGESRVSGDLPSQRVGPREYLQLLERAKQAVKIPVFASLNGSTPGDWIGYARRIEEAGADGLEVNVYGVAADSSLTGDDLERGYLEIHAALRAAIRIPIAFKLSPYFTSLANFIGRLDQAGVDALVLFNRFLQPDIDLQRMSLHSSLELSHPSEIIVPLRWMALLYGRIKADLAASTGVYDAGGVVKQLLAGATVVQLASALIKNGIPHLSVLRDGLEDWMERSGYRSVDDLRGRLSLKEVRDPRAFERAQYLHLVLSQNG